MVKEEKTQEQIRQEYVMKFAQAIQSMPLDNVILKRNNKYQQFTKEQIDDYLKNPTSEGNQKQLRKVVEYLTISSPQFNLLCNYLPNMALFNYCLIPNLSKYNLDEIDKIQKDYIKIAQYLQTMNIKQEFFRAITNNFYFDVYYGYEIESDGKNTNSYFIKPLNPEYCRIYGEEDGCYLIQFDFSYFTGEKEKLIYGDEQGIIAYPDEFRKKYEIYKENKTNYRWQQLDKGIATKYNESFIEYSIPPYIGLFSDLMDIEDYKELNKASVESDNYKLIALEIPSSSKEGKVDNFLISMDIIERYLQLLQEQIPEGVGFFPTPMKPTEMTFKKDNMSSRNNVQDATQNLFDATGFSKLLFSGAENSTALSYSVKTDEQKLFGLYRQFEKIVNRKLKNKFGGKFMIKILDMSRFTQKETTELLLKTAQVSMPTKLMTVASLGMTPLETMGLEMLENNVLKLHEKWLPLKSSYTQSGNNDVTTDSNRPKKDDGDLSDSGIQTREIDGNERIKGGV